MKLFFQKMGEGPVLIILHGLYGLSDNWLTFGRKLSEHFTVYLVDQRNHGRSPHSSEHTYPEMSDDLCEMMDSEGTERAIVLGHSMGGKTAMQFAAMYPGRLSGLIVVDIAPAGYSALSDHSPQVIMHMNIVDTLLSIDLKKFSSRTEIDDELEKRITDAKIRQFLMKNVHRSKDGSFNWKLNIEAINNHLPEIMGPVIFEPYAGKRAIGGFPVLFIRGGRSNYLLPEHYAGIKEYFPGAIIETIPGAGHWVHADKPVEFGKVVGEFLKKLKS